MDFTLGTYRKLLAAFQGAGYKLIPFKEYAVSGLNGKTVILRHDVDLKPYNSLRTALIEHDLGIRGTYYFRIVRESFDPQLIREIAALGHEIGYHYEDLALVNGDIEKAVRSFEINLKKFNQLYPVQTVCMHGSPLSKFDNRLIWQNYSYNSFGIIAEPYFDIDFTKVLYLSDTGRRWDGEKVSVRDKEMNRSGSTVSSRYKIRSSQMIIDMLNKKQLPDHIMLNFHPQRWSDDFLEWSKELVWQGLKNEVKRVLVKRMEPIQQ